MIRQILAALDGSDSGRAAGQYAAYLGAAVNAGVKVLNVIDVRALEGPTFRDFTMQMGLEPFETYTQALREVLERQAEGVVARFREDAQRMGLQPTSVAAVIETGIVASTICEYAAHADLVVMGQHGSSRPFTGGLLGSTSEQIVRRAMRPVMVCPPAFEQIRRPLVAYDGSEPADSALHIAADLATQLGTGLTVLVVVDGDQMTAERAAGAAGRAEEYLAPAGLETKIVTVEGYAEQRIVEQENGHDLVVMGAFGRSRLRELVVGSTTAYVMRKSSRPVVLVRI